MPMGEKYQVLNMVDIGTTFQLVAVVKKGAGQCSSAECLRILSERWFSWAGLPEQITCDRGLHNRGTLQRYMDEHGVRVVHAPLESPESIGRTERHGGLVKALFRKVSAEAHPTSKEQVEQVLIEVTRVKNSTSRIGGFSPAQWVLGRDSRTAPSQFSQEWADLGAIEAQADPDSIFALQHQARVEARKAFVHLDCSRRVQKALLRNAQPIPRDYAVGDLVCFRRDNQIGGTKWSPACRVIGKESEKKQSLFGTKMTALFSKANVLFGNSVQQKISTKKKQKLLNKQFVFSVNKRGDFVLPTLVSCAHVHTYTVHIVALHMSRSLYTLRASYISLLRTFYISRVGWEGLIKFEAFVFLALRFTWASVAIAQLLTLQTMLKTVLHLEVGSMRVKN